MPVAKSLRVLIVDDQASIRGITRYILQQIGINQVTDASHGVQALEALRVRPFDLVVSDWNMDVMDGLELLKTIRADEKLKKTPFIMVTGQADKSLVMTAAKAGVNNYVIKPFNAATLKTKIEQVLGKLT
ncbi:MAG: response regulator [Alphaproteobacteria bacterium]|nr:response regulator [Alphaproteobacteria bacterium]MBF0372863.1 response regulator [Alphaproteobacteria bacterium]MBF0392209.1 response regulator [Alphaproteobacteria bacterium]